MKIILDFWTKTIFSLVIVTAFVIGTMVTGVIAFADNHDGVISLTELISENTLLIYLEASVRAISDANLQTQIDTIQLTPGPQGEPGPQGIQGESGTAGNGDNIGISSITRDFFDVRASTGETTATITMIPYAPNTACYLKSVHIVGSNAACGIDIPNGENWVLRAGEFGIYAELGSAICSAICLTFN